MINKTKRNINSALLTVSFFYVNFTVSADESIDVNKVKALTPVESLMPMLFGLGVILLIIFGLAFIFRKFSNFGLSGKNIQVLETQMIGAKEKLVIVQVQEQQFLIGVTGQTISQLGELKTLIKTPDADESKLSVHSNDTSNSFSHIITKLIKGEPIIPKTYSSNKNNNAERSLG